MRINTVHLENIRSYVSQEIVFPSGSVLLWGNIGSGKSSILLAIDFALFGLQGDTLSGATLLRNGAENGSVTLSFTIDGKDIVVHRKLKRTKNSVVQDAGYVLRDGIREEKTAIELKQQIIDILHYPKDILTKNKDIIYRYTVYTPQEEMKRILLGSKEERLNTLRKVFGIDKYKQIRDNTKIVIAHSREKKQMYEGMVADLPEKIVEREIKEQEILKIQEAMRLLLPRLDEKRKVVEQKKAEITLFEKQREVAQQTKRELAVSEANLKHTEAEKEKDAQKIVERERKEQEIIKAREEMRLLLPLLEEKIKVVEQKKAEITLVEKQREAAQQIKRELAVSQVTLKHTETEKEKDAQKIVRLQRDIVALALEDTPIFESAKEKVLLLDEEISQKELDIRSTLNKIQELKTRKEHVQHIKLRIENLNSCPTCLQDVSPMHKHTLVDKSSREIHAFEQGIILQEEQRKILEDAQKKMRKEIELLKKKEHEMQLVALKVRQLQEKKEECVLLEKKKIGMEQTIQELTMRIVTLQTQMESFNALEILYPQIRTALDSAEQEYKKVEIEKHRGETTLQLLMQQVHVLADNIQKKKLVLEKKEHLNQVQFWLSDSFIPMVETIERNIMLKVHSDFNALFEKWFTLLVDTQTLHIALDEEFTPKILQDGYDTEYTSLSGGEKTAAALAYRLALNQIINSLNAGIKTNDLLILDEPTDGFSPEQLDRLRILMDELRIPQIILVSHEPQIESFVRTVLRFEKAGNETRLI